MPCDKLEVKPDAEPHAIPKVKPRTNTRKSSTIAKDMLPKPEIFPKPVFRPMATEVFLSENDWFKNKYEKEVASSLPPRSRFDEVTDIIREYLFRGIAMLPLAKIIEFFLKQRAEEERIAKQNFLIDQQQKSPSDDVPEIKWNGPLIKRCGCDLEDCDCQGDVLLPSKFVPAAKRSTGKKNSNWYTIRPENNLTTRLLKQLEAQEYVCAELKAMGILDMRGAEFCPYRCLHYNMPLATEDSKYFALRSKLLKSFKTKPKGTNNKVKSKKKTQSIVKRKAETVVASKRKMLVKQAKEGKRKKRKQRTKSKGKSELEAEDAYDVIPEPTPVIEIKGKSWVKKLEESLPSYYRDRE
ncbi:jg24209 [Pararge aegeria aegeria]|uniref:Jg24209 protein n=1 Tax=Pararge aegeria aegeria TaxID=348720 RepID=A0A8S4RS15_9NEOP|nr:jg24209 [Pararge aegeria aegeria]